MLTWEAPLFLISFVFSEEGITTVWLYLYAFKIKAVYLALFLYSSSLMVDSSLRVGLNCSFNYLTFLVAELLAWCLELLLLLLLPVELLLSFLSMKGNLKSLFTTDFLNLVSISF